MNTSLRMVLVAETVTVMALVGLLARVALGHRRDRARGEQAHVVQLALLDDLIHGTNRGEALLAALPLRWRTDVLTELATSVGSTERATLRALAGRCGVTAQAHARLSARRSAARVAGLRTMTPLELRDPAGEMLVQDPRAEVRAAAVWWLAHAYGDGDAAHTIAAGAADPDAHVRHITAESLIACGADAVPTVVALLADGCPAARRTALIAAAGLHDPTIADAASGLLVDADPAVRRAAARALVGSSASVTHDRLAVLLADPDPQVRATAAQVLGQGRRTEDAMRIGPLLHDPIDAVRIAAGSALVTLGPIGELAVRATARAETVVSR